MIYFRPLFWSFICFTSLKVIGTAKIYVVDVPREKDITLDNYDDYYSIAGNDYEDRFQPTQPPKFNKHKLYATDSKKKTNLHRNLCQRIFGSMYGNNIQQMKCLASLKRDQKSDDSAMKTNYKPHPVYDYYNKRTSEVFESVDLNRFSQDYLDVKDLVRSAGSFADNYVDVDDFRAFEGFRKALPTRDHAFRKASDNAQFRRPYTTDVKPKASSDSSESDEYVYKPSRYKVISDDNPKTSGQSSDSDSSKEDDSDSSGGDKNKDANSSAEKNAVMVANVDDEASDVDMEGDTSIELTTRRPKPKSKGNEKYVYLQGNNIYNDGDFRRRMSHFLPKRYHWDEDEYHLLGTFWFNGPRGKYRGS